MASRLCYGWGGCLLVVNRLVADVAFLGEGMALSWFLICTALACLVVLVLLGVAVRCLTLSGCHDSFGRGCRCWPAFVVAVASGIFFPGESCNVGILWAACFSRSVACSPMF